MQELTLDVPLKPLNKGSFFIRTTVLQDFFYKQAKTTFEVFQFSLALPQGRTLHYQLDVTIVDIHVS